MKSYNLATPEGREALRADRQAELDAIQHGTYPRDVNDVMRWHPPQNINPNEWAARMCKIDLDYLATKENPMKKSMKLFVVTCNGLSSLGVRVVRAKDMDSALNRVQRLESNTGLFNNFSAQELAEGSEEKTLYSINYVE